MSRNLLRDPRFRPLFWTQLLGAFNDNVFKNAMVILITFKALSVCSISTGQLVALSGGVFIAPFFLFSATAGQLADKLSKSAIIFRVKVWEILVMLVGAYGFLIESLPTLFAALFLTGLQSTFFGPVKYSILPQLLRDDELVAGNAYVETGTFLSILLGTVLGGLLIGIPEIGAGITGVVVVGLAVLGCMTSAAIEPLAPEAPDLKIRLHPIAPTIDILKLTAKEKSVFLCVLGISWFWLLGAALLSLLPPYCKELLHADESVATFFLALFSIGVGAGSLLCNRLSFQKLDLGLVPIGSIGISLFAFDLFLAGRPDSLAAASAERLSLSMLLSTMGGIRIAADFLLLAVSSGLFIVPLYAYVQIRSEKSERSRIIAGNNILNALFMVVSSGALFLLFSLGVSIPQMFLLLSLVNLIVAVYLYTVIPEFLLRFLCRILADVMYRVEVAGRERIPLEGAAVLACNHVSYVDWLIIAAACPRPIRFVMHYAFFTIPLSGRIFRDAKVIPIAGSFQDPQILEAAFERIAVELKKGEIVCIFPEGRITRDGAVRKLRPGVERIVQTTPVPVIPMYLDGLWGSFFSRKYGRPMSKPFRRFRSRVSLRIGAPIPPEGFSAGALQERISELASGGGAQ